VPGTDLPMYALRALHWRRTPTVLPLRRNPDPSPSVTRPVASSSSHRRVTFLERQSVRSPSHQIAQCPPSRWAPASSQFLGRDPSLPRPVCRRWGAHNKSAVRWHHL